MAAALFIRGAVGTYEGSMAAEIFIRYAEGSKRGSGLPLCSSEALSATREAA